jgi:hypothetical protein
MNWTNLHDVEDKGGRYLRREVIRPTTGKPGPRLGAQVKVSNVFSYADHELPEYEGRLLRLTRQRDAERANPSPDAAVDELYESLLRTTPAPLELAETTV